MMKKLSQTKATISTTKFVNERNKTEKIIAAISDF